LQVLIIAEKRKQKAGRFLRSLPPGKSLFVVMLLFCSNVMVTALLSGS